MESFKLILRIKTYPELYDPSHENYSKLDKKQLAWEKLALDLNESDVKIRSKWQNIRETYIKCINQKTQLAKSNQMHLYKRYKYEEVLSFLQPCISPQLATQSARLAAKRKLPPTRTIEPNRINPKLKKVAMSKSVNVPIQNIHYYSEEAGSSNNEEEPTTYVKEEQVYERSGSIAMEDAYGETEDVIEIAPETPQETILNFFLCMGHTCSLFSPMLQAQIKREVFEIISNAEIMNLENTDS